MKMDKGEMKSRFHGDPESNVHAVIGILSNIAPVETHELIRKLAMRSTYYKLLLCNKQICMESRPMSRKMRYHGEEKGAASKKWSTS